MDGRKKQPLPEAPISSGRLTAGNARDKVELAVRMYATVSRVKVDRLKQREAYLEVRRRLNETPEDDYSTGDTFSMIELDYVIQKMKKSAAGEDKIHPCMIKNLSGEGIDKLLSIINRSWTEGRTPGEWRKVVVIPIFKNGKPPSELKKN